MKIFNFPAIFASGSESYAVCDPGFYRAYSPNGGICKSMTIFSDGFFKYGNFRQYASQYLRKNKTTDSKIMESKKIVK